MSHETPTDTSTQALMLRYVDGDKRAFDALARIIEPKIRRFMQRRIHDAGLVDDLVQQTFLRVHASRDLYTHAQGRTARSVDSWFMTTAIRTLLDHRRHEYRRVARVDQLGSFHDPSGFGAPPPPQTPEQQLSLAEQEQQLQQVVRSAVAALPHDSREVIRRHKLEGQTIARVANDLGVAAGTLRVRAHRAYRKLAASLAPPPVAEPA